MSVLRNIYWLDKLLNRKQQAVNMELSHRWLRTSDENRWLAMTVPPPQLTLLQWGRHITQDSLPTCLAVLWCSIKHVCLCLLWEQWVWITFVLRGTLGKCLWMFLFVTLDAVPGFRCVKPRILLFALFLHMTTVIQIQILNRTRTD